LLERGNKDVEWQWITGLMRGLMHAILGINEASQTLRIVRVPPHFGYEPGLLLYQSYYWEVGNVSKSCILITKYDLELYRFYDLWQIQGSFCLEDFDKLQRDFSANFIYMNGGSMIIWRT
jgi:hypothetical protein